MFLQRVVNNHSILFSYSIVQASERIVRSLLQQQNFTNTTVGNENSVFIGERVSFDP